MTAHGPPDNTFKYQKVTEKKYRINSSGDSVMSVKIYGGQPPGPIDGIKKAQRSQPAKETGKTQATDKVEFSAVLENVSQAKETSSTEAAKRAEKVNSLKEQIAEGSYQPDLEKVAASLLKFLVEER